MASQFGKYLLQRKLAEGGMAEVFLAKQSGMDGFEKPVVIKRILPHLSGESHFLEMFLNEARIAARLSHPAIVQVFDFGKIEDQYYLAMEFVHGEDLRNLAKAAEKIGSHPPLPIISRVVADMLGGLHYAHTRSGQDGKALGLVHRDVSPQNVLVTYEGGVKLVDFGIAKATESQAGQQTQAGLLKGKYAYMSPEQCRGRPIDARSDVFSVGILLWELITWKRLFRRDTDLATMVAVAEEEVPPLSSLRDDIPKELEAICGRALARTIEDRYPTAQAMQRDLETIIRRFGWEADSIRLQQYMRELFADKLRLQDDAIRAAGVGSIEDFLVRADEGTQMAWMEGPGAGEGRAAQGTPGAVGPSVSGRRQVPAGESSPSVRAGGREFSSGSTLRTAVGQSMPIDPQLATGTAMIASAPPARWKRMLVIAGTSTVVAAAGLAAMLWPTPAAPPPTQPMAAARPIAEVAKVRVMADALVTVFVDGAAQPPGKDVEAQVSARAQHQLVVKGPNEEKKVLVPPLEPGEVHPVRLHFSSTP